MADGYIQFDKERWKEYGVKMREVTNPLRYVPDNPTDVFFFTIESREGQLKIIGDGLNSFIDFSNNTCINLGSNKINEVKYVNSENNCHVKITCDSNTSYVAGQIYGTDDKAQAGGQSSKNVLKNISEYQDGTYLDTTVICKSINTDVSFTIGDKSYPDYTEFDTITKADSLSQDIELSGTGDGNVDIKFQLNDEVDFDDQVSVNGGSAVKIRGELRDTFNTWSTDTKSHLGLTINKKGLVTQVSDYTVPIPVATANTVGGIVSVTDNDTDSQLYVRMEQGDNGKAYVNMPSLSGNYVPQVTALPDAHGEDQTVQFIDSTNGTAYFYSNIKDTDEIEWIERPSSENTLDLSRFKSALVQQSINVDDLPAYTMWAIYWEGDVVVVSAGGSNVVHSSLEGTTGYYTCGVPNDFDAFNNRTFYYPIKKWHQVNVQPANRTELRVCTEASNTPQDVTFTPQGSITSVTGTLEASSDELNKIYLVFNNGEESNYYDEYIVIPLGEDQYQWELIGTTKIDLSDYAEEQWVEDNYVKKLPDTLSLTLGANGFQLTPNTYDYIATIQNCGVYGVNVELIVEWVTSESSAILNVENINDILTQTLFFGGFLGEGVGTTRVYRQFLNNTWSNFSTLISAQIDDSSDNLYDTYSSYNINQLLNTKQDVLTEGSNITISSNGTISATYSNATTSQAGLMSETDKDKLDGIALEAQVNVIEQIKVNNNTLPITGKTVNIQVPTEGQNISIANNQINALGYNYSENTIKAYQLFIDNNLTLPLKTAGISDPTFWLNCNQLSFYYTNDNNQIISVQLSQGILLSNYFDGSNYNEIDYPSYDTDRVGIVFADDEVNFDEDDSPIFLVENGEDFAFQIPKNGNSNRQALFIKGNGLYIDGIGGYNSAQAPISLQKVIQNKQNVLTSVNAGTNISITSENAGPKISALGYTRDADSQTISTNFKIYSAQDITAEDSVNATDVIAEESVQAQIFYNKCQSVLPDNDGIINIYPYSYIDPDSGEDAHAYYGTYACNLSNTWTSSTVLKVQLSGMPGQSTSINLVVKGERDVDSIKFYTNSTNVKVYTAFTQSYYQTTNQVSEYVATYVPNIGWLINGGILQESSYIPTVQSE